MTTPETRICTNCKRVQETFEWRQRQLYSQSGKEATPKYTRGNA